MWMDDERMSAWCRTSFPKFLAVLCYTSLTAIAGLDITAREHICHHLEKAMSREKDGHQPIGILNMFESTVIIVYHKKTFSDASYKVMVIKNLVN